MSPFVIADKVISEVCEAVGVDPMRCKRVVIDLQVQHIPMVYVDMIGDDSLLRVTPPIAEGAKIEVLDTRERSGE